jgi:hypothetical protein
MAIRLKFNSRQGSWSKESSFSRRRQAGVVVRLVVLEFDREGHFYCGFAGGSAGASAAALGLAIVESVSTLNFL